jgi:hypothetical protein
VAIKPIVRYMLLCDNWQLDPTNNRRITIHGLMINVHSSIDPPYPLLLEEFCVFLVLTAY